MLVNQIRNKFIDFFNKYQHEIIAGSLLIPDNDPSLLFVNAGMVPFKDIFTGKKKVSYKRAVSIQPCVRAGGKHNDLENVGYTARHHTFFEMLGNFSFGDYFKETAIKLAWQFLTEELHLPKERLWISVYNEDLESERIWIEKIEIDKSRISRCGPKDNFWSMGETGPCGPCTEIFYDHGKHISGGPPGSENQDGDRYIEIWNLVFMQFDKQANGDLVPLPKPSVDTGMGLERLAAVLQEVHDNYQINEFTTLINSIINQNKHLTNKHGAKYFTGNNLNSLKVMVDHIRSCSFIIASGILPSNEGRGYVLRRIIRRALRHQYKLELLPQSFAKLYYTLLDLMNDFYPYLKINNDKNLLFKIIVEEEQKFALTLEKGMDLLNQELKFLSNKDKNKQILNGDLAFKLYDTYGFPIDLTEDIAKDVQVKIDYSAFEQAMQKQKNQSKSNTKFKIKNSFDLSNLSNTEFTGYANTTDNACLQEIFDNDGKKLTRAIANDERNLILIFNQTPFYAESGGQIGDTGLISKNNLQFKVQDTQKQSGIFLHYGKLLQGELKLDKSNNAKEFRLEVQKQRRTKITRNHSATHLLHSALLKILGNHIMQKGSLVTDNKLRFDFLHSNLISKQELLQIENIVNQKILDNYSVNTKITSLEQAKKLGAIALFGEKYGKQVRVVNMGEFSIELCGGIHTKTTAEIGTFKIIKESAIASGVRRIEAITGASTLELIQRNQELIQQLQTMLKVNAEEDITTKIIALTDEIKRLRKINEAIKYKNHKNTSKVLAAKINKQDALIYRFDHLDIKSLRDNLDKIKNQHQDKIIIFIAQEQTKNKASLLVGMAKKLSIKHNASEIANKIAHKLGGKGGGRSDFAQAGIKYLDKIEKVIQGLQT